MKFSVLFILFSLGLYSIGFTKDHRPAKHLVSENLQVEIIPSLAKAVPVNPILVDPNTDKLIVPFWLNTDLGFSSLGGIAGDVAINLMVKDKFIFSASAIGTTSASDLFPNKSWTDLISCNFMVGRVLSADLDKLLVSLSAGVSYSFFDKHTEIPGSSSFLGPDFEENKVSTIGFPVNLKLCVPTHSAIGLNLDLKADINKERTFFSFLIGLRIGRIQKR